MKNKLISLILIVAMTLCFAAISVNATEEFVLNAEFEFNSDGEFINVYGKTPAKYGQAITIVIYDPAFTNGIEDLREENGELSDDPATKKPLNSFDNIIRAEEVIADSDGNYSISFSLDGIENGQYLIVKASGSGRTPVSASLLRQYYTDDVLTNVTLPAFENATPEEIEDLLKANQLLLGVELGDDYRDNKDEIHSMFVSVRDNDCKVNSATGRKFNTMQDITNVLKIVDALRTLPEEITASDVKKFIDIYHSLIDYDFSTNNEHFTLVKNEMYDIAANILNESAPKCMGDVKTAITQAVALAMLNTKDAMTVAPVIEEYALILGLDKTDYAIYCEEYTPYQVNKAFVERNFKLPKEVIEALNARVKYLQESSSNSGSSGSGSSSGGSSGGGLGGGSSPNSGAKDVLGINDSLITSDKEKDEENNTYYFDITTSHWAYESIKLLSSKEIISGYPDGSFLPDNYVTREQLVKMIVLAFDLNVTSGYSEFLDVDSNRWSASYIKTAFDEGIVNGMNDGNFKPEKAVTRQDAAVMIGRAYKATGRTLDGRKPLTDSNMISSYAVQNVEELVAAGIISGFEDGSFRPMENLTRAQAAKLICGIIKE